MTKIQNKSRGEGLEEKKSRASKVIAYLKKKFPGAKIALKYGNPIQLLVSVVLSAQCTDKKVNEVTAELFKKYKTGADFAEANTKKFEREVKPCGFYRNKAKNIIAACKIIQDKFKGKLPRTMAEMLTLPGVARKTANVVLGNAFGVVEGIAVDTHMIRINQKLGFSTSTDPKKIERDLMQIIPKKDWFKYTYLIIDYGRQVCPARHKKCECGIYKIK
ncbi:MAG: endonuclease III [Parcubacteria group bacterium]|nr:endonuclease III [Parcubacteria group bacterium]